MKGFNANIEKETLENKNFRKVLYTGHHKDGIVRATKAEAEADGPEFDGKTTE